MRLTRAMIVGFLLASVLTLAGCKKKKPAVPPPQAEAPTVTQPAPEQPPAPAASEPNRPQPETAPAETATTPAPPAPAPAPKPKKTRTHAKKTPPPIVSPEKPSEKQPSKTVVNDGGTQPATPQLSADVSHDQAIHQKMNTAQLMEATDYNLKSITRALTPDEQGMVQTIRSYQEKARQANKDGDTDLAYRLAFKAHQLSDELLKH